MEEAPMDLKRRRRFSRKFLENGLNNRGFVLYYDHETHRHDEAGPLLLAHPDDLNWRKYRSEGS